MPLTPDEYAFNKRLSLLLIIFGLVVVLFYIAFIIVKTGEVDDFKLGVAISLAGHAFNYLVDNAELEY